MKPPTQNKSGLGADLTAFACGAVMPLTLAPLNWWLAGILSCAGLAALMQKMPLTGCFRRSFWYGTGMFAIGASWVYNSIHDFGNAPVPLAATLTALFVLLLALLFALPLSLFSTLNRDARAAVVAFPSLWIVSEWFRGWVFTGFPWLYLGYGFIDTPLAGWAPIAGVLAISWVAAFSGAAIALLMRSHRHRKPAAASIFLVSLVLVAGLFFNRIEWTDPSEKTITAGSIQPAVPLAAKWNPANLEDILALYLRQTRLLEGSELVIWPESAIPRVASEVQGFLQTLHQRATRSGLSLLVGIPTIDAETGDYYNSVISLGVATGSYHKQHLVPFGEYVPLEQWLRGTIDFFDLPMSSFSPGAKKQNLIETKGVKIATAICYEIAFPGLVAEIAGSANMILTVSNDSWFGDSLGPKQHFEMARMRALENSKPVLRSTNDGISAIIDHRGNITAVIPAFERTVLKGAILPRQGTTPFGRWGSGPILVFSLLMLLTAGGINLRGRARADRKVNSPQVLRP